MISFYGVGVAERGRGFPAWSLLWPQVSAKGVWPKWVWSKKGVWSGKNNWGVGRVSMGVAPTKGRGL